MVARGVNEASGYTPAGRPRVAVAADGTLAAIAEPARAVVLELPGGAPFAEIGIDPGAEASEVAWVGAPPRLIVLSRYAAHSTVHLIDPYGPRTIAEIRLEAPMRLYASVGSHALAVGAVGAAVLSATETHLTPYQFPSRGVPATAGSAAGNFVVALAGSIEEWDPQARIPKRRLKLPRPAVITALGGSDRVVWMVTQADPARVEVIPLINRGQPKSHELPEPIAHVTGHPRSDLLACAGAESGKVYVVDLDGRTRMRMLAVDPVERADAVALVNGRMIGVLAAQAGKRVGILALDGRDIELETQVAGRPVLTAQRAEPDSFEARRSTLGHEEDRGDGHEARRPSPPPPVRAATPLPEPLPPLPDPTPPPLPPSPQPPSVTRLTPSPDSMWTGRGTAAPIATPGFAGPRSTAEGDAESIVGAPEPAPAPLPDRFSPWKERIAEVHARHEGLPWLDAKASWRDDLVTWGRAMLGTAAERPTPRATQLEVLAERFDPSPELVPALALLYAAHLLGQRGAAPADVARVLGRRWDEALGTGRLAARGVARYAKSRVALAGPLQRLLDDLAPATGTLVGAPGEIALLGPCVVVDAGTPLATLAERHLARVGGAILAAHDDADPAELMIEARARGAVAMIRIAAGEILELGTDPAVLVIADEAIADQLDVPRL